MRAITVRQPWAWAIVHGGKNVENRSRNIAGSYRGPVAIHAGLTFDAEAALLDDNLGAAYGEFVGLAPEHVIPLGPDFVLGAVIGVAELVDVHDATQPGSEITVWADWCCHPWGQPGGKHLVLANPRPLPEPIPARGLLGLWTPSEPLTNAIQEALAA